MVLVLGRQALSMLNSLSEMQNPSVILFLVRVEISFKNKNKNKQQQKKNKFPS